VGLTALDFVVLVVYLIGITLFGMSFRGGRQSLKDYFLGGRTLPWWAISFSIVAAETSVLTIISTPGLSYAGNFEFLQLVLGYLVARVVISLVFLPAYFRGELFTAYQLMQRRFGTRVKSLTALIFLGGRAMAEGVRLFAMSIVISVVAERLPALGIHVHLSEIGLIGIIAALTLIYTFEGGLRAVIWTDFIQICVYLLGAVVSAVLILRAIPGGWSHVVAQAAVGHKFQVFDFHFSWTRPYTFWSGVIGGTFLTTATHGTDQLMVQRLLAARNQRESRLALLSSWVVVCFQFVLFLVIGVMLFVYHQTHALPPGGDFGKFDRLYPEFIARNFPSGLGGLIIAAILAAAMSNLSAALNSLSSTSIMDFYKPHLAPGRSERHYLWMSRLAIVFWTLVLSVVAYESRDSRSVLEAGLAIISYPFSGLLGIFLLGTLTRRANEIGAMVGLVCGVGSAWLLSRHGIPYTWFVVAGTVMTFAVGYLVSLLTGGDRRQAAPPELAVPTPS